MHGHARSEAPFRGTGESSMFRSFALTLALVLSAVSVLFLVIGKAASKGEAILPALPGLAGEVPLGAS